MGFRDKMAKMDVKTIYVRPGMLPESVAFKVIDVQRVLNKKKNDGTTSNVLFLQYKPGLQLMFYGDSEFQEFDYNEIEEYKEALKTENWFVVSYGKIGTNFVTKQMLEEKIRHCGFEIFDANNKEHVINDADGNGEQGSSPFSSPSKPSTSSSYSTPSKRMKM